MIKSIIDCENFVCNGAMIKEYFLLHPVDCSKFKKQFFVNQGFVIAMFLEDVTAGKHEV